MAEPVLPHGDLRNRREPVPASVQGGPDGCAERLHPQAGGIVAVPGSRGNFFQCIRNLVPASGNPSRPDNLLSKRHFFKGTQKGYL